jgi:glycosyltransferase involved in cell wall biosynthesis
MTSSAQPQWEVAVNCFHAAARHDFALAGLNLVDNNSTDGTAECLQEFRTRARGSRNSSLGWGPERVEVLTHASARGFAGAANQGLAQARGVFVMLLGQDMVVTSGWLKGLVKWSLHDWPSIGLVGPVINAALEEGLMLRDSGDWVGAGRSWLKLLGPRQGNYFASEEVGLRGFKTRQLLTEVYARQERWLEAEVQCRAALAERVDFEPAWLALADI